jgi:hypothetical protein
MSFHVIYASGWTKVGARCKRVAMNEVAIVSGGARRPEVCKRFKPTLRVDQVMDACDWLFDLVTVDIHSLLVHLDLHSRGPMEEYYPFFSVVGAPAFLLLLYWRVTAESWWVCAAPFLRLALLEAAGM